jgi:predicted metal-dependent RNase
MTATITFLGAAETVTGSRYLVETEAAQVLVDGGLFQEIFAWNAVVPEDGSSWTLD